MEMESLLREPTQERVKRTLFDQNLANKPLPRTDLLASNESVKTADSRRPPSSATSTTTKETVSDRRCPSLCE